MTRLLGRKTRDSVKGGTPETRLRVRTWLLPLVVTLLLVLELVAPYRGWVLLLTGLGGLLVVSFLWALSLARGVRIWREMRFGWAQVGDTVEERFTVENAGWAPAPWLEIVDHSTVPGYEAGRATAIGSHEVMRWRKEAVCSRRGLFTLGPTTVRTSDPFGLFTVQVHTPVSRDFLVVPPVVSLPQIEVAPGGRAGEGRPRSYAPEPTVSAASVREYVAGDSLRWIHWPTSARRGSLFVRLFDGVPAGDWWVMLDMDAQAQVGEGHDATDEHAVILAASLADRGLRLGRSVGLVAHGRDLVWQRPGGGEGRRWEIMRALALLSRGDRSLAELLRQVGPRIGQYASLVIVTPCVEGAWVESLVALLRRGVSPTVLLLDPVSFGGQGTVSGVTGSLADLGVDYYVVTRDLLDRPEARPGTRGRWEWRVLGTGRAMPVREPGDTRWKELA